MRHRLPVFLLLLVAVLTSTACSSQSATPAQAETKALHYSGKGQYWEASITQQVTDEWLAGGKDATGVKGEFKVKYVGPSPAPTSVDFGFKARQFSASTKGAPLDENNEARLLIGGVRLWPDETLTVHIEWNGRSETIEAKQSSASTGE